MAYLKLVDKKYDGDTIEEANANIYNVVGYVLRDKISGGLVQYYGGINVNPLHAAEQFIMVKNYFRKTNPQCTQVRQFVVSFCKKDYTNPILAYGLGYKIAEYYADRYQIIFGVHEDTHYLHIHFLFNAVSLIDGKIFDKGKDEYNKLMYYVNKVCKNFYTF